jgi:hypothetical protein
VLRISYSLFTKLGVWLGGLKVCLVLMPGNRWASDAV